MPPVFDATTDELQFFLQEAEEMLQILDDGLLALERDGVHPDLLQDIFRAAHTLKGSSATIGHVRMANLTHHLEDVFDKLRQNDIRLTTPLVDAGLDALDALHLLAVEVSTLEEAGIDIDPILVRLAAAESGSRTTDQESTTFCVHVSFEPDHPLTAARALQVALELAAGGEIIDLEPERSAIERAEIDGELRATVAWPAGRAHLVELLRSVPDIIAARIEPFVEAADPGLHRITVAFDESNPLRAARALQILLELKSRGRVLYSSPSMHDVEAERLDDSLEIHVEWSANRASLRDLIQAVPEIKLVEIEDVPLASAPAVEAAPRPAGEVSRAEPQKQPATSSSIRMSVERIDRMLDSISELVIERSRIAETARNLRAMHGPGPEVDHLLAATGSIELLISQIYEELMMGRMLPLDSVLRKFPRMVRDLGQELGKDVELKLDTGEVELDRTVIEAIGDPLIHLVRNAVDHAIEAPAERIAVGKQPAGRITIAARQAENRILVTVSDDGKGIRPDALRQSAIAKGLLSEDAAARLSDADALNLIFRSGFSTAGAVTAVSGRGVGMDIVRTSLDSIGGTIDISSRPGQGTTFTIQLPLTLAIIRALLVRCDQWSFAIPLEAVIETARLRDTRIHTVGRRSMMQLRDRIVPVIHLSETLKQGTPVDSLVVTSPGYAVVLNAAVNPLAVLVDELVGEQEVVVKPLGVFIPRVPGINAATILGDGSISLIVDVGGLARTEAVDHAPTQAA